MPKAPGTRSTLTAVNVDTNDPQTSHAVLGIVFAQATRPDRAHLHYAIKSYGYDPEDGVYVVVGDAGQRMHLGNALGLFGEDRQKMAPGVVAVARSGTMLGLRVTIWSIEDEDTL